MTSARMSRRWMPRSATSDLFCRGIVSADRPTGVGGGLFAAAAQPLDRVDIGFCFLVRRHAAMRLDGFLAGIVGRESQGQVAVEPVDEPSQVFRAGIDVFARIE